MTQKISSVEEVRVPWQKPLWIFCVVWAIALHLYWAAQFVQNPFVHKGIEKCRSAISHLTF